MLLFMCLFVGSLAGLFDKALVSATVPSTEEAEINTNVSV